MVTVSFRHELNYLNQKLIEDVIKKFDPVELLTSRRLLLHALANILESRVEQAYRPGSVPDAVIQEIAEQVAEENGDCRQALEILLRAGRKVDQQGGTEQSST